MILLNVIWPAIYVSNELWSFWFLIFATIIIETFAVKAILDYNFKKSFLVSLIGNLVSGLIGTFLMMYAMLMWHMFFDRYMTHATFDNINWIVTFIIMCIGSVVIEALTIKIIFKEKLKKLFIALLIGNILTYSFIAYTITRENNAKKRIEYIMYSPTPNKFELLDSTQLLLFTGKAEIIKGKNGKILNNDYDIEILFEKENPEDLQFNLSILGGDQYGGIEYTRKMLNTEKLTDTITVLLEQRNPLPGWGWKLPIITDTIYFVKRNDFN